MLDVIMKPRTNYSSNVLRRALPQGVNIQQKKESITMLKLKVLTQLKFSKDYPGSGEGPRKVKTV